MAAKTPRSNVKKVVISQAPWELVPILNPRTNVYSYKYRKQHATRD